MDATEYHYKLTFGDGDVKEFKVRLNPQTMELLDMKTEGPEWTKLDNHKCGNCPLDSATTPYCPVALGVADVIEAFKDTVSTTPCTVEITAPTRTYIKRTQISQAISALIGIYMVTSGCPIMSRMRPMVLTHLPFATITETRYRALAMYLLAQFFRMHKGMEADWDLQGLFDFSQDVRTINQGFCDRLHTVCSMDAGLNAVISLDCFAGSTQLALKTNALDRLEGLFSAYLKDYGPKG